MPSVYNCSRYNSTNFTTCCQVAITDSQARCPVCKQDVYPYYEGMDQRERDEMTQHQVYLARARRASTRGF